jgi:undecaprenyl phosphate-alpha-L-ara4N flippase subunit ArnE
MKKQGANKLFYILIVIPIVLKTITPLIMKKASLQMDSFTLLNILTNYLYWLCFLFFFAQAIAWQIILKKTPLSFAYPFLSTSYVLLLGTSYFVLNEIVTIKNIIGSGLIITGTYIFAKHHE